MRPPGRDHRPTMGHRPRRAPLHLPWAPLRRAIRRQSGDPRIGTDPNSVRVETETPRPRRTPKANHQHHHRRHHRRRDPAPREGDSRTWRATRLTPRFIYTAGITGAMQVATLVITGGA